MITRVSLPVLPLNVTATSSTRTLNKFWQETEIANHHRRLSQVRSQVEVGPPAIYPHIKINAKAQYVTAGNKSHCDNFMQSDIKRLLEITKYC